MSRLGFIHTQAHTANKLHQKQTYPQRTTTLVHLGQGASTMVAVTLSSTLREQHVVILGGAYAGLSTALNLLRICDGTITSFGKGGKGGRGGRGTGGGGGRGRRLGDNGRRQMMAPQAPQRMPKITILDPRDGFCTSLFTQSRNVAEALTAESHRSRSRYPHGTHNKKLHRAPVADLGSDRGAEKTVGVDLEGHGGASGPGDEKTPLSLVRVEWAAAAAYARL